MKKLISLLSAIVLFIPTLTVAAKEKETPAAVDYLKNRVNEYDHVLYVYKDFADGVNNYTQKAWMGDNYRNIPKMEEDAQGCTGISGIAAEIDFKNHSWGGYMFINGVLKPEQTNPSLDFGNFDAGLDLTDASKLVFYARGENGGEKVEFFMGGLGHNGSSKAPFADSTKKITLGYIKLTKEWKRYEISLTGVNLKRIACGFGWVSNDYNNPGKKSIRFYMDDIYYILPAREPDPIFLQSYASAKPGTDESIINNFAYLYDNAATAMALSYSSNHKQAQRIADAIVYALNNDRYFTDGRLRNAYMNGNPHSHPGWYSASGKEFSRIPGFYDTKSMEWYEDYYAVSTSTGNIAWAILALCEVYAHAPEHTEYLQSACSLGDFILTLLDDKGGFTGGYEGWERNQTKATYKSTEHNIDLISAFGRLAKLTGEKKYSDASNHAKSFVLSMYDKNKGCFYTGTTEDGVTINRDVLPLDCNTWALLALGHDFTDTVKVLHFIEENMKIENGYGFQTAPNGVWFEGTAQVALVYKLAGNISKYNELITYLNINRLSDGSITAANRNGVSTGFLVSGTEIPWEYGKRQHLGATAWLAFAQLGKNPFDF